MPEQKKYKYPVFRMLLLLLAYELSAGMLLTGMAYYYGYSEQSPKVELLDFKTPEYLKLLWLVLPFNLVFYLWLVKKNRLLVKASVFLQYRNVSVFLSSQKVLLTAIGLVNLLVLLSITAAQPVKGVQPVTTTKKNGEIVIVLDVSSSMNVKDLDRNQTRLDIAKKTIKKLLNNIEGQKAGIVVFAGNAYTYLPLTTDHALIQLYLSDIQTSMVSNQGTDMEKALLTSEKMFISKRASKTVLLITDAENHAGDITRVKEQFRHQKINTFILAISSLSGGFVPNNVSKPEFGYKVDQNGEKIVSKLDIGFLKMLTNELNAEMMIASSPDPDIGQVLTSIRKKEQSGTGTVELTVKKMIYQLPLSFAIAQLLILFIMYSPEFSRFFNRN